jgi:hypothetical protein
MSEAVGVKAFAAQAGIPFATIYHAINNGHLSKMPGRPARIDRDEAEAWARGWRGRADRERVGEESRQRKLNAQAVSLAAEIATLSRQLRELRAETAPRTAWDGARERAEQRVRCAIAWLPALHWVAIAEALKRDPQAVHAVLERFGHRLLEDARWVLPKRDQEVAVLHPPWAPRGRR